MKKSKKDKSKEESISKLYLLIRFAYRNALLMTKEEFYKLAHDAIDKYDKAYRKALDENPEGKVTVYRMDKLELHVKVEKKGTYKIYADESTQMLYMVSPLSGSYNYGYDIDNEWWQSPS